MDEKKLRICHICSYFENILYDDLITTQMEHIEPRVFYFKRKGCEKEYNKDYVDEVNCFSKADRAFFFLKEKKAYEAYIRTYHDREFDLYYAHSLFVNGYLAYRLKQKFGTPYIVMVQNTDLNYFFKYRKWLKTTGLIILLSADKIICASEIYRDELIRKYIPQKYKEIIMAKTAVIPYGIGDLFFEEQQRESDNPDKPDELISVGLICRNKNQLNLCKAVKKLRTEGRDIRLTIIGKVGSERILNKIRKYDFVNVLPFMNKETLKEYYRNSHIFALTSFTETFGLVYAEALSQGLPIIYTQKQGFDGQFPEGSIGYSVNAKSIKSIAQGISAAIDNYQSLSEKTISAADRFRWETVNNQYREIYREVTGLDIE